ncbi:MAG: hypothetical protein R2707_03275 [Acidimicrobiales bacterium]
MTRVAVVGSSPQLLVSAIRRARAGASVVVFEGRDRPGGAWTVTDFAGYERVEVACHLLERDADGYRVLRELGVSLAPMDPQPRTVLRPGLSRPYTSPVTATAQLAFYPVARTLHRTELTPGAWRRRRRLAMRELVDAVTDRSPVLGLVGGAGDLVDRLVATAEATDVEFRLLTKVDRVAVDRGETVVEADGALEVFDEVILSAAFDPGALVVDGHPTTGPVRRRSYAHRLLAMPAASITPHSYLRFPRDPVLQRCSDVTHAAVAAAPEADAALLLVSVRCDDDGTPLHDTDETLARLRRHGVIGAGEPSAQRLFRYQGRDGAATLRAAAGPASPVVVLDSFGDLTRALAATPAGAVAPTGAHA